MTTIDLKVKHPNYDANDAPSYGIGFAGADTAFIKADMSEPLRYCADMEREEVQELFDKPNEYFFGKVSLECEFTLSPTMGKGKQAMWFSKYFKNGYYEEPYE